MSLKVIHDQENKRFVARINNVEATVSYEQPSAKVLNFTHTFVPEEYRGQGIASELVKQALAIVRKEELKVKPSCWFVKDYVEKHAGQYKDMTIS